MNVTKSLALASLLLASAGATLANAGTIVVTVQNLTSSPIQLVSSSHSGFPATLGAGASQPVTIVEGTSRSDVAAVYTTGAKTCSFTGSHILQSSGPYFDKSATSTGSSSATCFATQSGIQWSSPYGYNLRFLMGD